MTVYTYNFNSLAEGANIPDGFGGSDGSGVQMYSSLGSGDTWQARAAAAYEGAMGGVITHNASYSGYITWLSSGIGSGVRGAGSTFTRMRTLPTTTGEELFSYGTIGRVFLRPTGEVYAAIMTDPTPTVIRNIATITAGQWLFIQGAATIAATDGQHRIELNVYIGGTAAGSSFTANPLRYDSGATLHLGTTSPTGNPFHLGRMGSLVASVEGTPNFGTGTVVDYDYAAHNTSLSSGFPGYQPTVVAAAGGNIKVFTGGTFAAKPVKVWTGTAWAVKPVKRWTGTAWAATTY